MTSEEYVNQVNRLMDLQTTYLNIFLWFLGVVIAIMLALQWWLNSKQMKQIKELTRQETIKEIEKTLGVSSLEEFKTYINNDIKNLEKENNSFGQAQLDYELTKFYTEEKEFLWHISYLMDIYRNNILSSFSDFNYFVSRVDNLISVSYLEKEIDIDIQSKHIDNIIDKMTNYESTFNKKSEILERFQNQIKYFRNQEK